MKLVRLCAAATVVCAVALTAAGQPPVARSPAAEEVPPPAASSRATPPTSDRFGSQLLSERPLPSAAKGEVHFGEAGCPGGCDCEYCDAANYYDEGWTVGHSTPLEDSWIWDWFGARHSSTHGRSMGLGQPLRGTSWLNRPYEVSLELGGLVMTRNPAPGVESANDLFAAIQAGWDWDHYWGSQVRVGWSTPSLDTTALGNQNTDDNLFITDVSLLYYPWGDSRARPYCRLGMGLTDIEYTDNALVQQQEYLYTIPIAIGMKYQLRRTIVWRTEFANNIAFGQNGARTTNNITLTFGVEGRFGGKSASYWAWHPRGTAW